MQIISVNMEPMEGNPSRAEDYLVITPCFDKYYDAILSRIVPNGKCNYLYLPEEVRCQIRKGNIPEISELEIEAKYNVLCEALFNHIFDDASNYKIGVLHFTRAEISYNNNYSERVYSFCEYTHDDVLFFNEDINLLLENARVTIDKFEEKHEHELLDSLQQTPIYEVDSFASDRISFDMCLVHSMITQPIE